MNNSILFFRPQIVRTPELVTWYDFQSSAADSGANGLNGTIIGTPTFVSGKVGNAVNFGNNSNINYVNIPDSDKLSFNDIYGDTPCSITFWVNFQALSSTANWLLCKRTGDSSNCEWQVHFAGNSIQFTLMNINASAYISCGIPLVPTLGTWYHITIVYDGSKSHSQSKIYLNGNSQTVNFSGAGSYTGMVNTTSNLFIGQYSGALSETLKHRGLIDSVGIWKNKMLTASEVSLLYNSGSGISYPPPF